MHQLDPRAALALPGAQGGSEGFTEDPVTGLSNQAFVAVAGASAEIDLSDTTAEYVPTRQPDGRFAMQVGAGSPMTLTANSATETPLTLIAAAGQTAPLLAGKPATGTNQPGGYDLTIAGPQGTGNQVGGSVSIWVSPAGTTGLQVNPLLQIVLVDPSGVDVTGNVDVTGSTTSNKFNINSGGLYCFGNIGILTGVWFSQTIVRSLGSSGTSAIHLQNQEGTDIVVVYDEGKLRFDVTQEVADAVLPNGSWTQWMSADGTQINFKSKVSDVVRSGSVALT